jgi:hypothetical protein
MLLLAAQTPLTVMLLLQAIPAAPRPLNLLLLAGQ